MPSGAMNMDQMKSSSSGPRKWLEVKHADVSTSASMLRGGVVLSTWELQSYENNETPVVFADRIESF